MRKRMRPSSTTTMAAVNQYHGHGKRVIMVRCDGDGDDGVMVMGARVIDGDDVVGGKVWRGVG
jgi:hypothetical protein